MKKPFKLILVLLIIAGGIYTYDLYSGYSLTKKVDTLFASAQSVQQNSVNESKEDIPLMFYSQLNDEEKDIYNAVYNGVTEFKENIYIRNMPDSEEVFKIFRLMLSEHPEIFWTKGNSTYNTAGILKPEYLCTKAEAKEKTALIKEKTDQILADATGGEYAKALYFFDYVVLNTEYDKDNIDNIEIVPEDSTIEGVFLENKAVCAGYAKAYQYLLNKAGMQAVCVSGDAVTPQGNSRHAWVYQQVNGEYCFSDPTWGDSYENGNSHSSDFASHTFFCRSGELFAPTHQVEDIYGNLSAPQDNLNYYKLNSLYFESYDFSEIRKAVKISITNNDPAIELEFADGKAYATSKAELIDNGGIYFILKSIDPFSSIIDTDRISYNCDDNHNILMFQYKKE